MRECGSESQRAGDRVSLVLASCANRLSRHHDERFVVKGIDPTQFNRDCSPQVLLGPKPSMHVLHHPREIFAVYGHAPTALLFSIAATALAADFFLGCAAVRAQ